MSSKHVRIWTTVIVALALTVPAAGWAESAPDDGRFPGEAWERVAPKSVGWSSKGLDSAIDLARDLGSDALLVVYDGVIIAEHGDITKKFNVRSIRKPLLGTLIGIEIDKGQLAVDATLADLDINDKGGLSNAERRATLADLMTSRSGVYMQAAWEHPSHAASRPARGEYAPGTHFYYNNWDFNALGTIYNQATHSDVFDDFLKIVAQPIGMRDYKPEDGEYFHEECSTHPAYIFHMTARDLARFGLLYLRQGRWQGQQIVPSDWVRESTRTHVEEATPHSGYGYLWRTYPKYGTQYAATGAGSQMVVVSPDARLVVVHLEYVPLGGQGVPRSRFWQLYGTIMAAAPRPGPSED